MSVMDYNEVFDLAKLSKDLEEISAGQSFSQLFSEALEGNTIHSLNDFFKVAGQAFLGQFLGNRNILISFLFLAILSGIVGQLSVVLTGKQTARLAHYMICAAGAVLSLGIVKGLLEQAQQIMQGISDFSGILMPVFCTVIGLTGYVGTSVVFYELSIFGVFVMEKLMIAWILPLLEIYFLLALIGAIRGNGALRGVMKSVVKGVRFLLKLVTLLIPGIGMLLGMTTTSADFLSENAAARLTNLIPGIGSLVQSAGSVLYGSVIVIKNAIGTAGIMMILSICLVPLCRILVTLLVMRVVSILSSVSGDQTFSNCMENLAEGCGLIFCTVSTSMFLLILTITSAALSTNRVVIC